MAKRTYYRDAKGRFASKGTPGAKAVTVDVDREKKRIKKELNQKQRAKLDEVLARKELKGKALTQVKKELDGMNLSELRKLTQKVGAKQPERYRNRKDAWKQAILDKVSGVNAGSKRRNLEAEGVKNPKPKAYTAKDLIAKGAEYVSKHLKLGDRAEEEALEVELGKVRQEMSSILESKAKGSAKKVTELSRKILDIEGKQLSLARTRQVREEQVYKEFINNLKTSTGVSRADAETFSNKVVIEASIPKSQEKRLREDLADLYQLSGGKLDTLTKLYYKDDRAYADFDGINIGKIDHNIGYSKNTLYHEVGHHLEFSDEKKLKAAIEYRNMMATSNKLERLKDIDSIIYASTGDDEVAMRGKFITPYAGKYYTHASEGGEYATEVTSMGLEHLGHPRTVSLLLNKAPEHLHYILGVLTYDSQG